MQTTCVVLCPGLAGDLFASLFHGTVVLQPHLSKKVGIICRLLHTDGGWTVVGDGDQGSVIASYDPFSPQVLKAIVAPDAAGPSASGLNVRRDRTSSGR